MTLNDGFLINNTQPAPEPKILENLPDTDFLYIKGEWKCKYVYGWSEDRITRAKGKS